MKRILPFLLVAAVVFAVYAPTLRNGFVWDDNALILRDPLIRSWRLIPEGFQHFLFTDATASDFYRPIQRLTYTLEYAAFSFRPLGYHVTSICCHVLAAISLLFFAREFLRDARLDERTRKWLPVLAAIVWAIHPLHTSAVAYIAGRADPLAAAFGFAGLYLGLRAFRASEGRAWLFTGGATALFLLSALSKESGLIFPLLWLALLLLRKQRGMALRVVMAFVTLAVIYLTLRLPAEHTPPPAPRPIPALVRPIVTARAFAEYAGLIVLPINLRMERDVETRPTGFGKESLSGAAWRELQTLAGLILLSAFAYWMWRERKHDRAVFALLVLTIITYVPVSGLFPLNATLAEHWLYIPSAFLFLAGALRLRSSSGSPRFARFRPILIGALALWALFLGARTFLRTLDWKDQRTFLENTIATGGNSARMLINLAGVEMNNRRLDDAKKHLEMALKMEPDQPLAVINLAAVAIKQEDYAAAHEWLKRALTMPEVEAQAHEMLAVLEHKETGKVNITRLRLASRTGTPNWAIEKRYIKVLEEGGAVDAAIAELRRCLTTQWYRAESWQLLSELLAKRGQAEPAAAALAQAQRYDAHLAERTSTP